MLHSYSTILVILFQLILLFASPISSAGENTRHTFSAGYHYSTGNYGAEKETLIESLFLGYKLKNFPWTWKASFNLLQIEGPGNISSGEVVNIGTDTQIDNRSKGVGDTFLSAIYAMRPWNDFRLYTDLGLKIKIPTADEHEGLGTGKSDIKSHLDFYRPFHAFSLTGTFAWKYRHNTDDFKLNNTGHFGLGLHRKFLPVLSAGLTYEFSENASGNNEHARELLTYLSYKINKQNKIQLYAVSGLSEGSPDVATGISFARLM